MVLEGNGWCVYLKRTLHVLHVTAGTRLPADQGCNRNGQNKLRTQTHMAPWNLWWAPSTLQTLAGNYQKATLTIFHCIWAMVLKDTTLCMVSVVSAAAAKINRIQRERIIIIQYCSTATSTAESFYVVLRMCRQELQKGEMIQLYIWKISHLTFKAVVCFAVAMLSLHCPAFTVPIPLAIVNTEYFLLKQWTQL